MLIELHGILRPRIVPRAGDDTKRAIGNHVRHALHTRRMSHLIDSAADIDEAWLEGVDTIGLTSGASAPDVLVDEVIARLQGLDRGAEVERLTVVDEQMHFALPAKLRNLPIARVS